MESIHDSKSKPWIHPEKIHVKTVIECMRANFKIESKQKYSSENFLQSIQTDFNLDYKAALKLQKDCSIDKLFIKEENDFYFQYRNRNTELNEFQGLQTLNARRVNLQLFKTSALYRHDMLVTQKYRTNYATFQINETPTPVNQADIIPGDYTVAVLTLQIFSPINSSNYKEFKSNNFKMQEYHVLSTQKLTEFKDIYKCVSDIMSPIDCSETPDFAKSLNRADDYTSSVFFIADTFYPDCRKPENSDYSETIRNWASENDRGLGPFDREPMENVKFEDLHIQLGYPYLYLHQGNCEHLLVFSDLRLHNPARDYKYYSTYPCMVGTVNKHAYSCNLCELNSAKWIVYENARLPHSPFYFCENCFLTFNYDDKQQPITKFKAFPYVDNSALM